MSLNNIRMGARLGMGYAAVLLLITAITALAFYEYRVLLNDAAEVRQQSQRTALAQQWADHTRLNITRVMAIAKSGNTPAVEGFFNPLITQTTQQINELQKTLEEQVIDQESTALLQRIAQLRTDYINNRRDFFALLATGDLLATENFLQTRLMPSADAYMAGQAQFVALQDRLTAGVLNAAEQDAEMAVLLNLGLAVVALVMSILISLSLTRSITTPLRSAIAFADKIAHGDLTHRMQIQRGDEIGDLIKSLNEMQSALLRVIGEIRHAGDGINVAASEIAMGNQDLSSRTEQSASSLEETASSMEQLTATVRQSADSARQANQLASGAAEVAARGGAVVGQVVHTMNDINQSSQRISDIISVIDGIAFQTNILALNAAVEAARAGEQGRGFAVVAGEVRTLAQRSAQAAKEIKELISASVGRVQDGSRLVEEAGTTMAEIVSSVQRVTDIIGEISAAASEQSDGISQVNVAISQLDQMTQQNAALVEQSAAAAQSMRDQTQRLTQAIAAFRTGDQALSPVTTSVPPPRPVAKAIAKAPAAARPPVARAAPGPLPAPRPHPAAQAKAIPPNRAASQPAAAAAAAAAAPRKVLPKAAPSSAPKPADNVEGDWESF
jgi:methyl-accepting chemotaxis protein